jgi:putative aldouronate transport system permease protein
MGRQKNLRERAVKRLIRLRSSLYVNRHLMLMLIPFLLYYILFFYKPFGGLRIAFLDYKPFLGIERSEWVGWDNFIRFFTGPFFPRLVRNTLLISVYNIIFGFPVPIILALLFYEVRNSKFRTLVQTVSYMPHFISTVVIAGIVVNFLSPSTGIVNFFIKALGYESIYFMAKPEYFRMIYVFQGIWAGAGFGSVIYYSSLCSIDAELFEAVKIDGGGRARQIWHIALPGILPTISIMLIMQVGNLLNVGYEMIILLYLPVTYETADVISSYMYRVGMIDSNYSMSTAVGLANGVVSLILVVTANRISKMIGSSSLF